MFKKSILSVLAASIVAMGLNSGCASMNNTAKGTLIGSGAGAAVGAGVGALVGKNAKGALIGAAIGTAVGAGTGAIIGKHMDNKAKKLKEQLAQQAAVETMTDANGLTGIKVTFDADLTFATGKAVLSASAQKAIKDFAAQMTSEDMVTTDIIIKGHTDNTGTAAVNEKLSLQRAQSVGNILKSNSIAAARVNETGCSFNEPVADNGTAAGRKQNRRVEVFVVATEATVKAVEDGTIK